MRFIFIYYLKLLLATSELFMQISGATLMKTGNVQISDLKQSLPFEDCGSKYDVLYLNIDSCTKVPCTMRRGSVVTVTVLFDDYGNDISFLKHKVRWVFNYIKSEAIIFPDPCDGNHECIEKMNQGKAYWANIYVNTSLPVMRGTMLWEAVDMQNFILICFEVPILITM